MMTLLVTLGDFKPLQFLNFALPFNFLERVNIQDFKFGVRVDYSKYSLQMTNCLWKGHGHVTCPIFNF